MLGPHLSSKRGKSLDLEDHLSSRHKNNLGTIRNWGLYEGSVAGFAVSVVLAFGGPFVTQLALDSAKQRNELCDANFGSDVDAPDAAVLASGAAPCTVSVWGTEVLYSSVFTFATSFSVILQVILLPWFAGLADTGLRNPLMWVCTWVGGIATLAMGASAHWAQAAAGYVLANLACGVCVVLLNALLPVIASSVNRDAVSSWGHAFGFVCGIIVILADVLVLSQVGNNTRGMRAVLVFAAAWWLGVSLVPLLRLPAQQDPDDDANNSNSNVAAAAAANQGNPVSRCLRGYTQFFHSLALLRDVPHTGYFLLANMFYSDGLWTVGLVLSTFGKIELGMDSYLLGLTVLVFQVMGCAGCFLYEHLALRFGAKHAIIISLVVFVLLCVYSVLGMTTIPEFFAVVSIGALGTGGASALSRSLFSQFIPPGTEAEFFSIYEVTDRGTAWLGPLVFGLVNQLTNSMRIGIFSLMFFFFAGLALLACVDTDRAHRDAEHLRVHIRAARQGAVRLEDEGEGDGEGNGGKGGDEEGLSGL